MEALHIINPCTVYYLCIFGESINQKKIENQGTTSQMQKDLDRGLITRLCRNRREEKWGY
jgi:hypothetical protein